MDQDLPDDVIDEAIKEGTLSDKIRGVITLFIAHIAGMKGMSDNGLSFVRNR